MKKQAVVCVAFLAALTFLAGGCAGMGTGQSSRTSNLSAYLYSGPAKPVEAATNVILSLPLHVGLAFVPADNPTNRGPNILNGGVNTSSPLELPLSESLKLDLMKQITGQFGQYPAIKSADLIPGDYLTPQGGFANLDQLRTLYGVDVMILISYDQRQYNDEGALSLSYWTIVGAYFVPAEKIDTKVALEAAVFDVGSRKLLFRAAGLGEIKGSATPVNLSEQLRIDSKKCFEQAATSLAAKLRLEIAGFKKQVAASPAEYRVEYKPGNTSGGLFGETE